MKLSDAEIQELLTANTPQFQPIIEDAHAVIDSRAAGATVRFFDQQYDASERRPTWKEKEEGQAKALLEMAPKNPNDVLIVDTGLVHAVAYKDSPIIQHQNLGSFPSASALYEQACPQGSVNRVLLQPDLLHSLSDLQAGNIAQQSFGIRLSPYVDQGGPESTSFDGGFNAGDFDQVIYYTWP